MRHIYNGDENEVTDLTGLASENTAAEQAQKSAAEQASTNQQPPRCVFSCLTQNMCVGELTIAIRIIFYLFWVCST